MGKKGCVLVVGGSHSVHVNIPAEMIRKEGYRVVLADILPESSPLSKKTFDKIYSLTDGVQKFVAKIAPAPASKEQQGTGENTIKIEIPTRRKAYYWRLLQGWLRARKLLKIIKREKPGVIHFQSMTACGMTAYYMLKRMGWVEASKRPGLLTHLWGYAPRFAGVRKREIRALKEFDHIHTSSPAVSRIYRENYEVPSEQISVFVRGIDFQKFRQRDDETLSQARKEWGVPEDKFVIVHNRHLHPMYRVDLAVDAFIKLAQKGHDVFLILVRGGMCEADYEKQLLAKISENGFADRVALMPPVLNADQMAIALQLSDCSVNCVPFDAFPVSILEAMYCGAVPVVRNLESYSQFIKDGETAFAVTGDVDEYADRIEKLITNPQLYQSFLRSGIELIEKEGSAEVFRQNTMDLIERCWHDWK